MLHQKFRCKQRIIRPQETEKLPPLLFPALVVEIFLLFEIRTVRRFIAGPEQSMKPMIGKSIDQSITIDYLLVNWHRLASANRWPIDNHTKVVATHRLSSIGVKKFSVCHVPACTYTHSQYARMFETIRICSQDCLYAVEWFQKSRTETHFDRLRTVWNSVLKNHTSTTHLFA